MEKGLIEITDKVLNGIPIEKDEAFYLSALDGSELYELFSSANRIRKYFRGDFIDLCSIINAKSGACTEDCKYCAQSAHYNAQAAVYPLITVDKIIRSAEEAKLNGSRRFCIVTSGRDIENGEELSNIAQAVTQIKTLGLFPCATLGILGERELRFLKDAGLYRYHHNLETSESFFSEICTTHTYHEKLNTIKKAKDLGLSVCCGGIFGMGEGWKERLDLAFVLRDISVDSIPINFLNPISGTPLEGMGYLNPLEALKIISLYRFILPDKEIRVCGGRNVVIRSLQPFIFTCGADGLLIGNYLTTQGRNPDDDLMMIKDQGLRW